MSNSARNEMDRELPGYKNREEHLAYQDFLSKPVGGISNTFTELSEALSSLDNATDKSGAEPSRPQSKPKRSPRKSGRTKVKSFLSKHYLEIILGVIVFPVAGIVWDQNREMGAMTEGIKIMRDDIDSLEMKYENSVDGKMNDAKSFVGFLKDLEFLKNRLDKIERRIGI